MSPSSPRLFVAGATGATGRQVLRFALERSIPLVAHVRPQSAGKLAPDARAKVFELSDARALDEAMRGCTSALQLIGTERKRFSAGDTYATSDIETTRQLVESARRTGVGHFVLLSSVGAGKPVGAYLQAKADAEAIVTGSGVPHTVFRPSAFMGDRHHIPAPFVWLTRTLHLARYQPIPLEDLARTLLQVAIAQAPRNAVLEGSSLWAAVDEAKRAA